MNRQAIFWTNLISVVLFTNLTHGSLQAAGLPAGFRISTLARVPNARSITVCGNTLFVGTTQSSVYAVSLKAGNRVKRVLNDLAVPNGVACHRDRLYVALKDRISSWPIHPSGDLAGPKADIMTGLPNKEHHGRRYIRFGPDGKLYLSVGTPCNICWPRGLQGSILRMNPDGTGREVIATGIRNAVGFDWNPSTQTLFFTDNGADGMGVNTPPDELNEIKQIGTWFGFPFFGGADRLPEFDTKPPVRQQTPPVFNFPAHVAPLGIHFYRGSLLPREYRGSALVAEHNNPARSDASSHQIVFVRFENGHPISREVFATGLGPPVDIKELSDGSILVSSDMQGIIYRITYGQ
ncbi:PQQ-dependent sugar dehydrogenase [Microvirga arabica]|uniref:PQQ-dependent sugar dehydrogenase n=1 Tax=Microvirga arabica TaxID=1128671 RepID=A0ABV6Y9X2_9HYPH